MRLYTEKKIGEAWSMQGRIESERNNVEMEREGGETWSQKDGH